MRHTLARAHVGLFLVLIGCSNAGAGAGGRQDAVAGADSGGSARPAAAAPAGTSAAPATATAGAERPATRTLASGTTIDLVSNDSINSRHGHVGDTLTASSAQAVRDPAGAVVFPAGTVFRGHVVAIAPAERPGLDGTLRLEFTDARVGGAWRPISARVVSMASQMHGRGVTSGDVVKVGAGTAAGAVAGRVIGGNATGTVIGAAAGTAAGAVYANQTRDIDIVLPKGNAIRVALTGPFTVTTAGR